MKEIHKKARTRLQAKAGIIDYIEMFYNSNRHHSYWGDMTPVECAGEWLLFNVAYLHVHFYLTTSYLNLESQGAIRNNNPPAASQ